MVKGRHISLFIAAFLFATATVYADMTPVSELEVGRSQSPSLCGQADLQNSYLAISLGAMDAPVPLALDLLPHAESEEARDIQAVQITADRQDSLSLCLYALFGLGLCRSAPFVKKLHFGCIPDWYHTAGPFQIGHSFAIAPDCLSPAPVYCFIQPVCIPAAEDSQPQYRWGTVISLWRQSQFTPTALTSRGPPSMS